MATLLACLEVFTLLGGRALSPRVKDEQRRRARREKNIEHRQHEGRGHPRKRKMLRRPPPQDSEGCGGRDERSDSQENRDFIRRLLVLVVHAISPPP